MKQHEIDQAIEQLFDKYGASAVFNSAERVCGEKADYVAEGGSHGEPSAYLGAYRRGRYAHRRRAARTVTLLS